MLSTRRSEIAPARSKRPGSEEVVATGSTGAMVAGVVCGTGLVMPRAMTFYARNPHLVSNLATAHGCTRSAWLYFSCQAETFQGVPSLVALRRGPWTPAAVTTNFGRAYRGIDGTSVASWASP